MQSHLQTIVAMLGCMVRLSVKTAFDRMLKKCLMAKFGEIEDTFVQPRCLWMKYMYDRNQTTRMSSK